MRAALFHQCGDASQIKIEEAPEPQIGSSMGSLNDFREVMGLVLNGTIDPIIDSVYPLEQAAEDAYARYERGEQFGKIVLQVR